MVDDFVSKKLQPEPNQFHKEFPEKMRRIINNNVSAELKSKQRMTLTKSKELDNLDRV